MKMKKTHENVLLFIWSVSLIATVGSLFYSEVMGYTPCELCWVQRIFMYPLIIIYGATLWKKNLSIALPGLILSGIGMFISGYHYTIQKVPMLREAGESCGLIPCHTAYVNYFGFITIPFLAGVAFILIFVSHFFLIYSNRGV